MRKKSVRTGFTFGIGDPMLMPESLRVPPTGVPFASGMRRRALHFLPCNEEMAWNRCLYWSVCPNCCPPCRRASSKHGASLCCSPCRYGCGTQTVRAVRPPGKRRAWRGGAPPSEKFTKPPFSFCRLSAARSQNEALPAFAAPRRAGPGWRGVSVCC